MKRVLVVSDTHGHNEKLKKLLEMLPAPDVFIHCGDGEGLEHTIGYLLDPRCEIHMVHGNCDTRTVLTGIDRFTLGKHTCMLVHGHRHGVRYGLSDLAEAAQQRGCSVCFFGHTHVPVIEERMGVLCINPGSLTYPRQEGRASTYLQIEVDEDGEWHLDPGALSG